MIGRKCIGTVAYMGGIPCVPEKFCWSWGQMVQYNQEILVRDNEYIHYDRATFSDHAPARNSLVSKMLGGWLIQLDCDHIFEPDIIHRLLGMVDEHGCDIVSGLYRFKTPPYSPVAFIYKDGVNQHIADFDKNAKLIKIDSVGAGCLFVKRHVFDIIRTQCKEEPFTRFVGWSEDHSFCKRARECGFNIWLATKIESQHMNWTSVEDANLDGYGISEQISVGGYK